MLKAQKRRQTRQKFNDYKTYYARLLRQFRNVSLSSTSSCSGVVDLVHFGLTIHTGWIIPFLFIEFANIYYLLGIVSLSLFSSCLVITSFSLSAVRRNGFWYIFVTILMFWRSKIESIRRRLIQQFYGFIFGHADWRHAIYRQQMNVQLIGPYPRIHRDLSVEWLIVI